MWKADCRRDVDFEARTFRGSLWLFLGVLAWGLSIAGSALWAEERGRTRATEPKPAEFPMMAWDYAQDEAMLKSMRDCGINVVAFVPPKMLDACQRLGLKAIVFDERIAGNDYRKLPSTEQVLKNLPTLVREVNQHPAVYGYHLKDDAQCRVLRRIGQDHRGGEGTGSPESGRMSIFFPARVRNTTGISKTSSRSRGPRPFRTIGTRFWKRAPWPRRSGRTSPRCARRLAPASSTVLEHRSDGHALGLPRVDGSGRGDRRFGWSAGLRRSRGRVVLQVPFGVRADSQCAGPGKLPAGPAE